MTQRRQSVSRIAIPCGLLAFLAACATTPLGPTVQVMPGPGKTFDQFQADQSTCKTFATQQVQGQADAANRQAAGAAVLTTVLAAGLGAGVGAAAGDAGAGAAIGAAAGAAGGGAYGADASAQAQANIQGQYDNAFAQCMYAKGEQVPGYAPIHVATAAPVRTPDPMVRSTQSELIRLGYLKDTADGFMGPRTRSAIAAFEAGHGMSADGAPSAQLLARLQSTPSGGPVTASAPAWVAPTTSGGGTPPATPVAASGPGWVAPTTKSP